MTFTQFLRRYPEGQHLEWVNGRAVEMCPVTFEHQQVRGFLLCLIATFAEEREPGVVRMRPFQMKTGPNLPARSPDITFILNAKRDRLKEYFLDGPADLAIEVADAGSRGLDRGEKFYEYEEGGVGEYWLIDPERRSAEFYLLGRDKRYHLMPVEDGILRSVVLKGLCLRVDWLWQRPLPKVMKVLKEWGLV
jgi:Uma2 family endonuclease